MESQELLADTDEADTDEAVERVLGDEAAEEPEGAELETSIPDSELKDFTSAVDEGGEGGWRAELLLVDSVSLSIGLFMSTPEQ
jgi:hypothetical protein